MQMIFIICLKKIKFFDLFDKQKIKNFNEFYKQKWIEIHDYAIKLQICCSIIINECDVHINNGNNSKYVQIKIQYLNHSIKAHDYCAIYDDYVKLNVVNTVQQKSSNDKNTVIQQKSLNNQ